MTPDAHIDAWLRSATEDAERRGLGELVPLLETLARSTAQLRHTDRQAHEEAGDAPGGGRDENGG